MTITDEMIEAAAIAIYDAYINDPVQYDDVKASSEVMARAAITAVLPLLQQDWQPIETAPKDGTRFVGLSIDERNSKVGFVAWHRNDWVYFEHFWGTWRPVNDDGWPSRASPTNWMPLPKTKP